MPAQQFRMVPLAFRGIPEPAYLRVVCASLMRRRGLIHNCRNTGFAEGVQMRGYLLLGPSAERRVFRRVPYVKQCLRLRGYLVVSPVIGLDPSDVHSRLPGLRSRRLVGTHYLAQAMVQLNESVVA